MGFDGKTLDSSQSDRALQHCVFAARQRIEDARKIIAAFEQPENKDKGVVALDGRMVERLHAEMARRIVAIADAIAQTRA